MIKLYNLPYEDALSSIKDNDVSLIYADISGILSPGDMVNKCLSLIDYVDTIIIVANQDFHVKSPYLIASLPFTCVYPPRFNNLKVSFSVFVVSKKLTAVARLRDLYCFNNKERIVSVNQKPALFYDDILQHFTKKGDTVADCLAGRGAMTLAALSLSRNCVSFEENIFNYKLINNYVSRHMFANKQFTLNYYPFYCIVRRNAVS